MARIIVHPDCGNAPRKKFLRDLNISIANGEMDKVTDKIADEIEWNIPNTAQITGKNEFLRKIKSGDLWKVEELRIDNIITHGADASVSGIINSSNKKFAFCHIYKFGSAGSSKVKAITTFMVEIKIQ